MNNTAIGNESLRVNTSGYNNTGVGFEALKNNTTGLNNVAVGKASLYANTTGYKNTGLGVDVLSVNDTGYGNTAIGFEALKKTDGGFYNTALGYQTMEKNTTGSYNVAIGMRANAITNNYTNTSAIGYGSNITAQNQVRLGNNNITSIGGFQNWTNVSDQRFKQNISENVKGLKFINLLRPVTYTLDQKSIEKFFEDNYGEIDSTNWDSKYDASNIIRTGFLAQEVEAAAESIGYDFSGVDKPKNEKDFYGLRYAAFTVPLVKAVQELNQNNEELKEENQELKNQLEQVVKDLEEIKNMLSINQDPLKPSSHSTKIELQSIDNEQFAKLEQNTPNPFNGKTTISYFLPEHTQNAVLQFSDLNGRVIKTMSLQKNGHGNILLQADDLDAGIYTYTLLIDGRIIDTKKMILTK